MIIYSCSTLFNWNKDNKDVKKIEEIIENNVNLSRSYYFSPLGFAKVDSANEYKPYLYVVDANKSFLDSLSLIEGRLPENSNEIVISEHVNTDGQLKR